MEFCHLKRLGKCYTIFQLPVVLIVLIVSFHGHGLDGSRDIVISIRAILKRQKCTKIDLLFLEGDKKKKIVFCFILGRGKKVTCVHTNLNTWNMLGCISNKIPVRLDSFLPPPPPPQDGDAQSDSCKLQRPRSSSSSLPCFFFWEGGGGLLQALTAPSLSTHHTYIVLSSLEKTCADDSPRTIKRP